MKKTITFLAAFLATVSLCAAAAPKQAAASADGSKVNMLTSKSDWSVFESASLLSIENKVMSITPTTFDAGATYVTNSFRNATIELEYQMSYDPAVDPYTEDMGAMLPGSFWGIMFGNEVTVDENWVGGNVLPFQGSGGYPYMLCFDTERQLTDTASPRYTQVGLSLRRYDETGGHAYAARWSSVDPGDFSFMTSIAKESYSITPEYSKPITVTECFNTEKHTVKLDYRAEYKSKGDENDGVVINVWFDEELVLTVVDEMPVMTEKWGVEVAHDKRNAQGYVGIYAHHASVSDVQLYDWKVDISNLYITDLGSISDGSSIDTEDPSSSTDERNSVSEPGENPTVGCGGIVTATATLGSLFAAAAVVFSKRSKEE